jgi:ribosome biogenesis SPOUT family RNA methylase Rps3
MTEIETLTALNIAQKRIVELIGKTTDDAEIRLLLRDKMTIDEAVKVARNSIQNHTLVKI